MYFIYEGEFNSSFMERRIPIRKIGDTNLFIIKVLGI